MREFVVGNRTGMVQSKRWIMDWGMKGRDRGGKRIGRSRDCYGGYLGNDLRDRVVILLQYHCHYPRRKVRAWTWQVMS